MLNNVTRSQKSFLHKCVLFITIALFLTLVLYRLLDKITSQLNYYLIWYNNRLSSLLLSNGFSIDKVVITGNKFTNEEDILNLINKTQPIMYVSLSKLADNIQSISKWIKYVRIYRILPNTLYINVDEHKPFALWNNDNKTSVINSENKVITDNYLIDNLNIITEQNSLSNLKFTKDVLERKTQLSSYVFSCVHAENRKCNMILNNSSTVKLPEDNLYSTWDYSNHLQSTTSFTFLGIRA
nr:FtsQ-type POTRA domain-containing protein [Wolbachia endosymbiont of Dirofilaria (Dirofilaria) immitis]